jgi:hypothetical protein
MTDTANEPFHRWHTEATEIIDALEQLSARVRNRWHTEATGSTRHNPGRGIMKIMPISG